MHSVSVRKHWDYIYGKCQYKVLSIKRPIWEKRLLEKLWVAMMLKNIFQWKKCISIVILGMVYGSFWDETPWLLYHNVWLSKQPCKSCLTCSACMDAWKFHMDAAWGQGEPGSIYIQISTQNKLIIGDNLEMNRLIFIGALLWLT